MSKQTCFEEVHHCRKASEEGINCGNCEKFIYAETLKVKPLVNQYTAERAVDLGVCDIAERYGNAVTQTLSEIVCDLFYPRSEE